MSKQENICIATISGPHGIQGHLKIQVHLDVPEDISEYDPVLFQDGSTFPLKKVIRSLPRAVIVSARGVTDRDAALALRGEKLYITRGQLPEVEEENYYHTDLIGLSVFNEKAFVVGLIKHVHDYGAGPILEIEDPKTHKSILVPFRKDAVPEINLKSKEVVVRDSYLQDFCEE
ncbi:ribosome maturation factor RimM [Alphaproteobacteria bacterium]|nr:ribosome maturation factor RimM [Alphaproteobacteria bacterium]